MKKATIIVGLLVAACQETAPVDETPAATPTPTGPQDERPKEEGARVPSLDPESTVSPAPSVPEVQSDAKGATEANSCDDLKRRARRAIAAIPADCSSDAECTSVGFRCPFGCAEQVSKEGAKSPAFQRASKLTSKYRAECGACAYRCRTPSVACVEGRCAPAGQSKPQSSSGVDKHVVCESSSDCGVFVGTRSDLAPPARRRSAY